MSKKQIVRPTSGTGTGRSRRGFAGMDSEKQREIASKGGKAAHLSGNAHKWTTEEAREAGRKGGMTSGVSKNRHKPSSK